MDKYLKHDVLIGREVLSLGFGVSIDADKFCFYNIKRVNVLSLVKYEEIINSDTNLIDSDKTILNNMLRYRTITNGIVMAGVKDRTIAEGLAVVGVSDDRTMTEGFVMAGIGNNNCMS
ncbi:uncharacterized protein LOC121530070 [Drosophila eugracilis]|uniref:uncharacterized protein LOC121530070 n=1 Tax=Drosophila eugracilis TaxID=29029 RepID=UPI001BD9470C|nr:uncharacterized protein LOC121530070 [Drosophila eugracilis]